MNKENNMIDTSSIGIKRTFTDFFGEVKKVSYIGPYMRCDADYVLNVTRRADQNKHLNVDGFPVTQWEVVEWSEDLRKATR